MSKYIIIAVILIVGLLLCLNLFFGKSASGPNQKLLQKYYDELAENPNNAVAYMEIARDNITAFPEPYDVEKALSDISKAIELDPNLNEAYHLRAMLYFYTLKDTKKALADLDKALELNSDDDYALNLKNEILNEIDN